MASNLARSLDPYPLSAAQEGMLLRHLREPGSETYVQHVTMRIEHPVDEGILHDACRAVIARHELLRTAFQWDGSSEPVHVPHAEVECPIDRGPDSESGADAERAAMRFVERDRLVGFDLRTAPLIRMTLFRSPGTSHVVWSVPHIIADGGARDIFLRDLWTFYDALEAGESLAPEPAPSYRDFIDWYRQQLDSVAARRYWRDTLADRPASTPITLPAPVTAPPGSRRGIEPIDLDETIARRVEALAVTLRVSVNTIVQAAWAIVLARHTGVEAVMFGATFSGRHIPVPGVEEMFGLLMNTLPIAAHAASRASVRELVLDIRRQHLGLRPFVHTPATRIAGWAGQAPGHSLFDTAVVFAAASMAGTLSDRSPRWSQRTFTRHGFSHYDAVLFGTGRPRLQLELHFDRARFEHAAMTRLSAGFTRLLDAAAADPDLPLSRLSPESAYDGRPAGSGAERRARSGPATHHDSLHGLVLEQARRTPTDVAVVDGPVSVTYAALIARAQMIAAALAARSLPVDARVGICLDRDSELVASILGVLIAGACYVPLEPTHPAAHLQFVLADSSTQLLVTNRRHAERLSFWPAARTVYLDDVTQTAGDPVNARASRADRLAYIIYTSGSTGTPKGVAITHRNAVNFVEWAVTAYTPAELHRTLCATSITFDMSVFELFAPLAAGGATVLVPDILAVPDLDRAVGVTLIKAVPSSLRALARIGGIPSSVRTINSGGERLDAALVQALYQSGDLKRLVNTYGPTETTTSASWHDVSRDEIDPIPIGKPIRHAELHVLGPGGCPVPLGVVGELYIGGAGVAPGYIGRPELTAERFLDVELPEVGLRTLYRTGDLARCRDNGDVEVLGRVDNQIKVRGFRIEPEEIEAAINILPGVVACAVSIEKAASELEPALVALVVSDDRAATPAGFKRALRARFPEFMVPSRFVFVPELPRTVNGKLDRKALPLLIATSAGREAAGGRPPRESADDPRSRQRPDPPSNPVESAVASIWASVLDLDEVGVHDDFFDVGGDSLVAIRVVSRIRQELGCELPVTLLFDEPTVARIAARIAESHTASRDGSALDG